MADAKWEGYNAGSEDSNESNSDEDSSMYCKECFVLITSENAKIELEMTRAVFDPAFPLCDSCYTRVYVD